MASIIKNQIIKHLSAFARNITPDQISLEVLSGRGELRNIELNEKVLTEKLELPPWLKICKAVCNKVTVKVPWTRIKKAAVEIYVDEITVSVRLLSSAPIDLRKAPNTLNTKSYDLAERVVEGLSLYVMTVDVQFESDSFGGSLMFSRLSVESKTPQWRDEKNIHFTRVHDKQIRQVLFFKQVSWQLLRVEASAHTKNSFGEQVPGRRNAINSPLRLITGDGKCRIAIKKDDTTCAVIDGRIEMILEDILWVATLVQVRSAIDFYKHILDLANAVQKPTENNPFLIDNQQKQKTAIQVPTRGTAAEIEVSKAFKQFDIHQSSYHLYIGKIDLHLFDDSNNDVLPENWNTDNGAIQATLYKLRVDFYPFHQVFSNGQFSERLEWVRYHSPNSCTELATKQLEQHLKVLSSKLETSRRERFLRLWPQLNSQNVVIRVEDVVVQCVSEQSTKKESLLNMFVQDKPAKNCLPQNLSFFHIEFTSYYFPASNEYQVPPDSTHMVVGPFEFLMDYRSIRWMVYVFENILNAFEAPQVVNAEMQAFTPDFRVELFMPKIIILPAVESLVDSRLPSRFLVNFSTIRVSNFVLLNDPSVSLPVLFQGIDSQSLKFVEKLESSIFNAGVHDQLLELSQHSQESVFKTCSTHIHWFLSIPSFWLSCDFSKSRDGQIGLVNDVSLAGCIVQHSNHIAIMLEPQSSVDITLDHFQFVQLMQVKIKIVELLDQINLDRQFFAKKLTHLPEKTPLALFCLINQIHVSLILPTGPVPSPYDLKCSNKPLPTSATSTSLSSELPTDENSLRLGIADDLKLSKQSTTISTLPPPITNGIITSSLHNMENNSGREASLGELTTIQEFHPSRKQVANFPDFPNTVMELETASNTDAAETMSVTTTTSDNERQFMLLDASTIGEDDIFYNPDIEVAKEASLVDEQLMLCKRKEEFFKREVNVFDLLLDNTNIFLTVNSKHPSTKDSADSITLGYTSKIQVSERFNRVCRDIYNETGRNELIKASNINSLLEKTAQLRFEVHSRPLKTCIKVDVSGIQVCLSDEIISQLAPFLKNDAADDSPPVLEISMQNCDIEIKDPKKIYPLRLHLGELKVKDGPEENS